MEENSSKNVSRSHILELIEQKKREGNWTFTFLGCDIDAYVAAASIGVSANNVAFYQSVDAKSSLSSFNNLSLGTRRLRGSKTMSIDDFYSDDSKGKIN